MKSLLPFYLTLIIIIVSGCSLFDGGDNELEANKKSAKLIKADNEFGFELFQNVVAYENEADNIMVSPLSVALALAMTYNGADGDTKTAMEETLNINGLTTEYINQSYENLVSALKSLDEKVLLEIANAIFYREDFEVEPDFISVNQSYYDADVSPLDFESPEVLDVINGWVAEKTHDKITTILDEITFDQVMFLLNAIYFKGSWEQEFNSESTDLFAFNTDEGETKSVDMMCRLDTLDYTSNNLFSAIKLPYGSGNYNMYVFLPETEKNTQDVINELNQDNWETWMDSFVETENVDIRLPKFKFEYEITLNDVLSDMGMEIAFSNLADFTGINSGGGLAIGFVKHKTFVDVNEEGTEAAAVTIVSIEYTTVSITGPTTIPFYVNKPFLFAITEKDTEAILFIGEVNNPEYN